MYITHRKCNSRTPYVVFEKRHVVFLKVKNHMLRISGNKATMCNVNSKSVLKYPIDTLCNSFFKDSVTRCISYDSQDRLVHKRMTYAIDIV